MQRPEPAMYSADHVIWPMPTLCLRLTINDFAGSAALPLAHAIISWVLCTIAVAGDVTPEALAAMLARANALRGVDFRTRFEMRVLRPALASELASAEHARPEMLERFDQVFQGSRMRSLREALDPNVAAPRIEYSQLNGWSDGTWFHRVQGDRAMTLTGRPLPTDFYSQAFVFNLCEGRYPTFDSLSAIVATCRPITQSMSGDDLTYRFSLRDVSPAFCQHVVTVRLEPVPRLIGHAIEYSSVDEAHLADFANHVYHRQSFQVIEWKDVDGIAIPWVAYVDTVGGPGLPPVDRNPLTRRAIYTRQEYDATGRLGDQEFEPEFTSGLYVSDERLHLAYRVGEAWIIVDGVNYRTTAPIESDPRERLSKLIADARPTPGAPTVAGPSTRATAPDANNAASSKSDWSSLTILLLVGGILFIAYAILRGVRRT